MSNQCITYESLMASLKEISGSEHVDPIVRANAQSTFEFLSQHPNTSQLVKEGLSNTSCKDISEIAENLSGGYRNIGEGYKNMAIGQSVNGLTASLQTGSQNLYRGVNKTWNDAGIVLSVAIIVAGLVYGARKAYTSGLLNRLSGRNP